MKVFDEIDQLLDQYDLVEHGTNESSIVLESLDRAFDRLHEETAKHVAKSQELFANIEANLDTMDQLITDLC